MKQSRHISTGDERVTVDTLNDEVVKLISLVVALLDQKVVSAQAPGEPDSSLVADLSREVLQGLSNTTMTLGKVSQQLTDVTARVGTNAASILELPCSEHSQNAALDRQALDTVVKTQERMLSDLRKINWLLVSAMIGIVVVDRLKEILF